MRQKPPNGLSTLSPPSVPAAPTPSMPLVPAVPITFKVAVSAGTASAKPPNVAPSATIPIILILIAPRPAAIQAQLAVESKGLLAWAADFEPEVARQDLVRR